MKFRDHITGFVICILLAQGMGISYSQSIDLKLAASGGDFHTNGNVSLSYSIGEPVVTTLSSGGNILTQGFQQPLPKTLSVSIAGNNASCIGANNAFAVATPLKGKAPFTYQWYPYGGTKDTSALLPPGNYKVKIKDSKNDSVIQTITLGEEKLVCALKFYSGLTPNNDGDNDTWQIESVESFPDNSVSIYNRYGEQVWKADHYNNKDVVWRGTNRNDKDLPAGTYYYVVKIDRTYTGWVEITR